MELFHQVRLCYFYYHCFSYHYYCYYYYYYYYYLFNLKNALSQFAKKN